MTDTLDSILSLRLRVDEKNILRYFRHHVKHSVFYMKTNSC